MLQTDDVLFKEIKGDEGNLGVIELNRPQALNALTHEMCRNIDEMLRRWAHAEHIKAVIIYGAGEKAFSAGGDIIQLYHEGKNAQHDKVRHFFWDEYNLNYLIHFYPKPFISLLDGITMGGGVGVSIHGSHCVVTERFVFAMPETAIGFFPDIGGSYFLSRCPGETGVYLGLTGMRLNAAEAIYVELAEHFVSSNNLDEVILALAKARFGHEPNETVTEILQQYSVVPETPKLAMYRQAIDKCFSNDTVEEIFASLKKVPREWHRETLEILKKKSPLSLKVTLREIREGVALDFNSCMQMEFRLCQRFMRGHDFYEGVRAFLIERCQTPKWDPSTLEAVTSDMVDSYFAKLPEEEELQLKLL